MKPALLFLPLLLVASSCDSLSERQLIGSWQGAGILEDGVPLDLDPAELQFHFFENGLYTFQGTLNYKEAGTFKMTGELLYTLDTINEASSEKAVMVTKLSEDSLFLKMQTEGNMRLLKLYREN